MMLFLILLYLLAKDTSPLKKEAQVQHVRPFVYMTG